MPSITRDGRREWDALVARADRLLAQPKNRAFICPAPPSLALSAGHRR
jgi:hypothetical protein